MKAHKSTALGIMQQKAKEGGKCAQCPNIEPVLNVDHIIAVSLLQHLGIEKEAGRDDMENLQLLCRRCNVMKRSYLDFYHPKTFLLLEKYVALSKSIYSKTTIPTYGG